MKFEQIIFYSYIDNEVEGVLNFKADGICSFSKMKDGGEFVFLRIINNPHSYRVKYDDLKTILDKQFSP